MFVSNRHQTFSCSNYVLLEILLESIHHRNVTTAMMELSKGHTAIMKSSLPSKKILTSALNIQRLCLMYIEQCKCNINFWPGVHIN